jgi:hypothetical protein
MDLSFDSFPPAVSDLPELLATLEKAKARYDLCMQKSFRAADRAQRAMDRFRAARGADALYVRLCETARTTFFGSFPGRLFWVGASSTSARQMYRQAQIARQLLPELARQYHRAEEELRRIHRNMEVYKGPMDVVKGAPASQLRTI